MTSLATRTIGGTAARSLFPVVTATLVLVACGSSDSNGPTTGDITISGTAVKGAALAGATISVKCANGTASATAAANGAYVTNVPGGSLPCAVKAVGTDGTTYHSVIAGTGNFGTYVANISPLTEMVVSHVAGALPATFFSAFGSATMVTAGSVASANAYVQTAMAGLTSLAGINPLTDPLVVGNALDQKIDAVVSGIAAANLTVAQVTAAIISNPSAPGVVATPLAPAATGCAWLKSGKYRLIDRIETDPKLRFRVLQVNATTLTATDQDNTVIPLGSDGACQFSVTSDPVATSRLMVSSGGMWIIHRQSKTVATDRAVAIAAPEQVLPISELAGTWNADSWYSTNIPTAGAVVAATEEATIDASGQITAMKGCLGLAACIPRAGPFARFAANAAGGFDVIDAGSTVGRAFLYKTLAGKKVLVFLDDASNLTIASPQESVGALPAVGTVSAFRFLQINNDNTVSPVVEDSNTVTATDAAARTVTRIRTSTSRVDTQTYDKPRDGLRHRPANSCTIGGTIIPCAEVVQQPLQGMGVVLSLSAVANPSTGAFYEFSVIKP